MTYRITRFCCTSGMCIDCRAVATGRQRKRIVHASGLSKETAEKMLKGWSASYWATKMEPETEGAT